MQHVNTHVLLFQLDIDVGDQHGDCHWPLIQTPKHIVKHMHSIFIQ